MSADGVNAVVTYAPNTYELTVNYIFTDGSAEAYEITLPVTYGTLLSGESYVPAVPGYDDNAENLPAEMPSEDVYATVSYYPRDDTPYTVEYYLETVPGVYTAEPVYVKTLYGTTGDYVIAEPDDEYFEGYWDHINVDGDLAEGVISGDGSLVLRGYYDVNIYEMNFKFGMCRIEDEAVLREFFGDDRKLSKTLAYQSGLEDADASVMQDRMLYMKLTDVHEGFVPVVGNGMDEVYEAVYRDGVYYYRIIPVEDALEGDYFDVVVQVGETIDYFTVTVTSPDSVILQPIVAGDETALEQTDDSGETEYTDSAGGERSSSESQQTAGQVDPELTLVQKETAEETTSAETTTTEVKASESTISEPSLSEPITQSSESQPEQTSAEKLIPTANNIPTDSVTKMSGNAVSKTPNDASKADTGKISVSVQGTGTA